MKFPYYRKGRVINRRYGPPVPRSTRTALVKKVNRIAKMVKSNKPELKYAWNYNNTLVDNLPTAFVAPYRTITQGTTDLGNRIGDDISVKKCKFTGWLDLPAGSNGQIFRAIAFIMKRNPDAITTSFSTIINLYLESTTMNTSQAPNAFMDWDNHGAFVTLFDKKIAVNPTTSDKGTKRVFNMNISIPTRYQKVSYANGGIYPTDNELIIAFLGDNDNILYYTYTFKVSYTDA